MKGSNASGITHYVAVDDLARAIDGSIVHRNDGKFVCWIIYFEQSSDDVGDDGFFVMCGDEDGDGGPLRGIDIDVRMPLFSDKAADGEAIVPDRIDTDENHDRGEQRQ